jgi:hypothetical protein
MNKEWIGKPKEFFENLSHFIDKKDNKELAEYLKGTGGLISFGIGMAKLFQDYRNSLKSEYEQSLSELLSALFDFTSNYLRQLCFKQDFKEKEDLSFFNISNIRKELKEFIISYKDKLQTYAILDSPWLPLHPIVQEFKQQIIIIFNKINDSKYASIKEEFESTFEDKIERRLYDDPSLEKFRSMSFDDLSHDRLLSHLDFIIKDYVKDFEKYVNDQHENIEISSNSDIYLHEPSYIENRKAAEADISDWNQSDGDIYQKYENKIKNAEDLRGSFINSKTKTQSGPQKPRLLIGAPFGIGKTSLIRKIAYEYAKRRSKNATDPIP